MRNINSTKLNKQSILDKISQEQIFATYLNIPIEIVKHCVDTGELICSPIREDKHPTVGFKYDNRGKLKYKDFNGTLWGDCFDIVAMIISVIYGRQFDINNKKDFIEVLRHISFTFKDIYYGTKIDPYISGTIDKAINELKHNKQIIDVVIRDWNKIDENYWNQFGISIKLLNINFIYPVDQYYINRKINPHPKYYYDKKDLCYCYNLGQDNQGINNIKLYFPNRSKGTTRFITNCNILEGIYNLNNNEYDFIILTKSTKDRLSIISQILKIKAKFSFLKHLTFGVINIPHETYKLRQIEIKWFISKLSKKGIIISLMDNDTTGINHANWINAVYNIPKVFIPKRYKAKDFADLVKNNNEETIINLIKTFITYYNERKRCELQCKIIEDSSLPY